MLSDLPRFQAARQALQLSSNSAWNSVQTAVINVFKGGGLQNNELYTLNENIRRLLKSELGSFITDYFQNQLLAKGLLFIEEKVKLCEGEDRIDILSEIWDHYFTETLPTLQAIFYPVQKLKGSGVDHPPDCSSWLQRLGLAKSEVGRNSSSGPDKASSFHCPDAVNSAECP